MNEFADKLDYLLRTFRKPDGTAYTYSEIAEASNGRLTISNLSQLRHGRTKPGYDVIQALCDIFGVEPNYFFDSDLENRSVLEPKPVRVDDDVMKVALRLQALDEDGRDAILKIAAYLKKAKDQE